MADMVQVVMGHEYGRERIQRQIVLLEYLPQPHGTDSGIDEESTRVRSKIIAVAAASAGKAHELYHYLSSLFNTSYTRAERSVPGS